MSIMLTLSETYSPSLGRKAPLICEVVMDICKVCNGRVGKRGCIRCCPQRRVHFAPSRQRSRTEHGPQERCSSHGGKLIEYYCAEHSDIGCNVCMTLLHRNCDIVYIPSVADEMSGHDYYRDLDKSLRDLGCKYEEVKKKSAKNVEKVENDFRRSLLGIRQLRKNVNTYFDKLESELVKVLMKFKESELEKMKTVSTECTSVTAELNAVVSELEYKRQHDEQDQFFIALKKSESTLRKLQEEIKNLEHESQTNRFKFQRSADVSRALKEVTVLGDIAVMKDPEDTAVDVIGDVSVCFGTEGRYCSVTGATKLEDGPLVIADYNNKSVKLLNMEQTRLLDNITMTSEPWDLTCDPRGRVAVTLPNEEKIVFLSPATEDDTGEETDCKGVSEECYPFFRVDTELPVYGKCKGIASYGDRFIVTYCDPPRVEIIEADGKVLRRLGEDGVLEHNFVYPEYVALSPDQTMVYVSDRCAGKVMCFTIEGKFRAVFKDRELTEPGGVIVDKDGTVYICDTTRSEIHMLTPEGSKIRTVLDRRYGLVNPTCVTYSEAEDKLFVGTSSKGVVSTFQIR